MYVSEYNAPISSTYMSEYNAAISSTALYLRKCLTDPFYRRLTIRRYAEHSVKIIRPLRAVLITDLHSTIYGNRQEILLKAIWKYKPDLILMAGDIADHKVPHEGTLLLLKGIEGTCPGFYVSGNHEQWTGHMPAIQNMFASHGITVLSGRTVRIQTGGQTLLIGGVDDPHAYTSSRHAITLDSRWKSQFWHCCSRTNTGIYSILLSHRPELTKYYRNCGFDLVVSGHAHGGQVRIPGLMNGLLAPHQGFFPRYAGGQYQLGSTSLIVSRGLCLNRLPRICNPPELVIVDLMPV